MAERFPQQARTTHNDLIGTVAINFEDSADDFVAMAQDLGIDVKRYQPVAVELVDVKNSSVRLYAIDTYLLEKYSQQYPHQDRKPVRRFDLQVPVDKLLPYLRQLHLVLHAKHEDVTKLDVLDYETDKESEQ